MARKENIRTRPIFDECLSVHLRNKGNIVSSSCYVMIYYYRENDALHLSKMQVFIGGSSLWLTLEVEALVD